MQPLCEEDSFSEDRNQENKHLPQIQKRQNYQGRKNLNQLPHDFAPIVKLYSCVLLQRLIQMCKY